MEEEETVAEYEKEVQRRKFIGKEPEVPEEDGDRDVKDVDLCLSPPYSCRPDPRPRPRLMFTRG